MRSKKFRCSSATSTEESKNSFGTQSQNRTDQTILSRTQNPNFMWWLDHNRPRWISQHFPKRCEVCRMNVIRWHVTPQPCSTNGQDSASIEPPPHFHCWFNPPNPVKAIHLNQTARSTRCNITYAWSWKNTCPFSKNKCRVTIQNISLFSGNLKICLLDGHRDFGICSFVCNYPIAYEKPTDALPMVSCLNTSCGCAAKLQIWDQSDFVRHHDFDARWVLDARAEPPWACATSWLTLMRFELIARTEPHCCTTEHVPK